MESKKYLLQQRVKISDVRTDLWEKTVTWIKINKWKIIQMDEREKIKFKHVRSSVRAYDERKIEILFNSLNGGEIIYFDVFTNTKYPVWTLDLRYKEVLLDYLYFLEVNLTNDILRGIFSRSDLNRLIRGNFFGILLFSIFIVSFLEIAFTFYFLLGYLSSVSFFVLSISSIRNFIRYAKIKKNIYG